MGRELTADEYYHVYNRGVKKQPLFYTQTDQSRFLTEMLLFQSPKPIPNFHRLGKKQPEKLIRGLREELLADLIKTRLVRLNAFSLMPNHFHLLVQPVEDGGLSKYMHRLNTAYAKYFNIRHGQSGHVFQGRFQAVRIESNEQFLYLSAYIHKNCSELKGWRGAEEDYPWSSLQDYVKQNRWGKLLDRKIINEQFKEVAEYLEWVKDCTAKELEGGLF